MEIDTVLTQTEQAEFEQYEAIIDMGLNTFFKVGEALAIIKEKRLYRQSYSNFEDYCRDRWDFGRHRAGQLIKGNQVYNNLLNFLTNDDIPLPTKPAQVEPLASLSPEQQASVWVDAINQSSDKSPTGKQVKQAVSKVKAPHSKSSVVVESQVPELLYKTPYSLPIACSEAHWRIINRTFNDPAWVGQVLLAASYFSQGELSEILEIEQGEAGPVLQPWD